MVIRTTFYKKVVLFFEQKEVISYLWTVLDKYYIYMLLICCMQANYLNGQTPTYVHYDVSDGLPGNIVYCAAQDERGFMWFGTDKGLACFDGTRFRIFGVKDGLPDPEVLNLKLDSQERLWVFCFRKNPCYFYKGKLYTEKEDKVLGEIELKGYSGDIYEDSLNNGFWFTGNRLHLFFLHKDKRTVKTTYTGHLLSHFINHSGKLLGFGLNTFREIDKFKIVDTIFYDASKKSIATEDLGGLQVQNKAIISANTGTFIVKPPISGTFTITKILDIGGRVSLDKSQNIWISSSEHGAICYLRSDSTFSTPLHFLNNKKTTITFQDNHFGYWFCTAGEGVYYLPENHSLQYFAQKELISNNITTINQTSQYGYVGGDDQGNLYSFSDKIRRLDTTQTTGINRSRQILDQNRELLIASDAGLTRFNGKNNVTYSKLKATKYIIPTPKGLYMGTASNIYAINNSDFEHPRVIYAGRTTAAAHDPEGTLWIGGLDGLYTETDSFKQNWGERFPALKNRIITLDSDQKHLWAVTPNDGLLKITTKHGAVLTIDTINTLLHTPIDNIQALHLEKNGRIWLATNTGVYGINKDFSVIRFNSDNGLLENDVNDIYVSNDTLWAATVSGLIKINLSGNKFLNFPTFITQMRYKLGNNTIINYLQDTVSGPHIITVPTEASLIELEMAALDYGSRSNLQYACIIKTLLPSLLYWTTDNVISFISNGFKSSIDTTVIPGNVLNFGVYLAPAHYQIQVQAINPNGVASSSPAIWTFKKKPEWYQTIWLSLAILALIGLIIWRANQTAKSIRQLRTAAAEFHLQAIQAQINPHFIGNSINAIQQFFFPPDQIRATEYISSFTRMLRATIDFSEQHFVSIVDEIAYNEDYLRLVQLRFGTRFHYTVNISPEIDIKTTFFPTMLLQPILENCTIHGLSPEGPSLLDINIKRHNGLLIWRASARQ